MSPSSASTAARAVATIGLILALLVGLAAWRALQPPPALPESAPAEEFSALRAMRHVERLAVAPRPPGSVSHREVRDYLLAELEALGLVTELQITTVVHPRSSDKVLAARVENVIGRLPGGESGGAVLLMAHYDSRPRTPGAGDDASGVAAILETLRALRQGETPRNDLIALFTDAEELGLLGARAFAEEHPWADEVAVVLNFESRGSSGPANMFETGPANLELVRILRQETQPTASSLSYEIYRRMPNDTDFSVFRDRDDPGLNFAFINGHPAYHSMLDTPERLAPASLQHLGSQALGMARHLGRVPLPPAAVEDGIYFNLLRRWLVIYPASWVVPLLALAAVAAAFALALSFRAGAAGLGGLLRGWVASLLTLVGAGVVGYLFWWAIGRFAPDLLDTPHGVPYATGQMGVALALLVAASGAWITSLRQRELKVVELAGGSLLTWLALGAVTSFLMPGASFLFVWPAVALALSLIAAALWCRGGALQIRGVAALALAPVVPALLLTPVAAQTTVALTLRMSAAVAILMALPMLSVLPLVRLFQGGRRPWLAIGAAAAGLAMVAGSLTGAGYDANRPRVNNLLYVLDAERGESRWVSFDEQADPWTALALGEVPARIEPPFEGFRQDEVMARTAPLADLAPPRLEVLSEVREGPQAERTIEVRIRSERAAPAIRIEAESSVPIRMTSVDGKPVEAAEEFSDSIVLDFFGLPPEGIRVVIEVPGRWPVEAKLVDQSYGLPDLDPPMPARPREMISSLSWRTDATYVMKTVFF